MSFVKATFVSMAIVGMGLSSSAFAETRARDLAPRAGVVSKASAMPKVQRRSTSTAAYGNADGTSTVLIGLLGGIAVGAGGCAVAHCYGHTSP
jgi:hypothetical protein